MSISIRRRRGLAALALSLMCAGGVLSGCGTSDSSPSAGTVTPVDSTTATATFGPDCDRIPALGAGSFGGMAIAPVATAAGANPLLSSLVTAVRRAGLVDTLNSADGVTIFAPANSAIAKLSAKQWRSELADRSSLVTLLHHHMVAGQLTPAQLAGSHKTLAGDSIRITGSSPHFAIGPQHARVLCGNITTANATVYIIDTVLAPGSTPARASGR